MIESSHRLRMSLCNMHTQQIQQPSLVPDFSCVTDKLDLLHAQFSSGLSRATWECSQSRTLIVAGVCIGNIREVSPPLPEDLKDLIHTIRKSEPENLLTGTYHTGESLLEAYVSTLRVNLTRDRWPGVITYSSLGDWTQFYASKISSTATSVDFGDASDHRLSNLLHASRGRTFMVLEKGHFGLGPPTAQPGEF